MDKGKVIVRNAVASDIEDILAIGDVFYGIDYLPHYLAQYLQNPDYLCHVCQVGEKVVAFHFLCLIDDGETLESGGLRVHPNYRQMRLSNKLADFVVDQACKVTGHYQPSFVFTSLYNSFYEKIFKEGSASYKLLFLGKLRSVKTVAANILRFLKQPAVGMSDTPCLHYPTEIEFINKMASLDIDQRKALFPDNLFVVYKKPLKLIAGNFKKVYKMGHVFWSGSLTNDQRADIGGAMMSCVRFHPCQGCIRLDHYIYGEDVSHVQTHVFHALDHLTKESPVLNSTVVEYVLYYPLKMDLTGSDIFDNHINWQPGGYKDFNKYLAAKHNDTQSKL